MALYGTIFPVPSPESELRKVNCNDYVLKNIVNNNFMLALFWTLKLIDIYVLG